MKVALLHHQMIRATGVETFLIEFAKRLSSAGHEVTCITTLTTPDIAAALPVRWELLPRLRGSATMRMWHFNRLAPRAARAAAADWSIGFGRTCTQDIHRNGTGALRLYGNLLPLWQRYSLKHLYELHLERQLYTGMETQRFVVGSARIAAQLQGIYGTRGDSYHVMPPPIESGIFRPAENRGGSREIICRKMETDSAHPVLLFVSLSHRRRGLEPLLEALKTVDATLWIVGKGLNPAHREFIRQHHLEAKVRVAPVTMNLAELYQSADWLVHPTQYDAFSTTVLQSMACGLPCLVSVMDGAVDLVRNGENGFMLYHPQQPEELASRIREALDVGDERWRELSDAACATAKPLTWEQHLNDWAALME